ncbi:HxsD-like protein [Candidatus Woesearchaeota archaeon]|nr:HxsD-like protein [Candidatus Woesearchaeota archaeon]
MNKLIIDKKKNEVKLNFDTRFYGFAAILAASKDFTESCWIFMDGDKNDQISVNLKPKSKEIDINNLGYDFYNYVLGLMQNAIY